MNHRPRPNHLRTSCVEETIAFASRASAVSRAIFFWPATCQCECLVSIDFSPTGHHSNAAYISQGIRLSEREAAILQGFPDHWCFCGKTKASRWSQIGQAVPPALMEAVARSIVLQMQKARALSGENVQRDLDPHAGLGRAPEGAPCVPRSVPAEGSP